MEKYLDTKQSVYSFSPVAMQTVYSLNIISIQLL